MPQLDLMTFFTQFFWFSLGFSFFYITLLHYILPTISLSLKYRKKKLAFLALDINKKKGDASNLLSTYDNIIYKAFNFSRNHLAKVMLHGSVWTSKNTIKVNLENDFLQANSFYLRILGEKDFGFSILNISLKNSFQDSCWTKLWTK